MAAGSSARLRANLNWQSPALRHALRTAVTAALPLAFTMFWFMPYDHWLTITVVATMQPYFSLTYTRALERIVGTALGGAIAAAVGLIAPRRSPSRRRCSCCRHPLSRSGRSVSACS